MTLLIVINCTFIGIKKIFLFWRMNLCILTCVTFSYVPWLSCLFSFTEMPRFFIYGDIKQSNQQTHIRHLKADDTLLKITIRGLLIKMLKVLSVPRVK